MILRNGEKLGEKEEITIEKNGKRISTTLEAEFSEIRSSKKPFIVRTNKVPIPAIDEMDNPIPSNKFHQGACWDSDYEGALWQYVRPGDYIFSQASDKYEVKNTRNRIIQGEKRFHPDSDFEEIFYFKYISSLVKKRRLNFYDQEVEDDKKAEINASLATAQYYITSPDSPYEEATIRELAAMWNVANADTLHMSAVRNKLWDAVHKNKDYSKFVEQIKKSGDTAKKSTILIGIQRQILEYSTDTRQWFINSKGGTRTALRTIPLGANPEEGILRFLTDDYNESWFAVLEDSIKDGALDRKPKSKYTGFELEKKWVDGEIERNTADFKALFKKYDVVYVKRQKAEYTKELNDKIKAAMAE